MLANLRDPKRKEAAINAIQLLKDSASYEDMMYELYVLQKIDRGRKSIDAARTKTHEEVGRELSKWVL